MHFGRFGEGKAMVRIKHSMLILALLLLIVIIGGCTNKSKVTKMPSGEEPPKESIGSTYGFSSFNLTIDTKELKEAILAEYSETRDKTEARYENKIENIYFHGNKAMKELNTIFKDLSIDPEMDDEDIIKKTSEAFEMNDYTRLMMKVKFKGYDHKELMFKK